MMFISDAFADTTTAVAQPSPASSGLQIAIMLGVFILFMYFVTWRPQNKRAKEHRQLINSLTKGDEVITAGGILGTVSKVSDQYIVVALADNVEITIQKSSIVSALPKGTLKSI